MIDDFCQSNGFDEKHRPGPASSLPCSEVVTLAVFGQWAQFPSECAFYRYALSHLRTAFPTLPDREQFNRLQRKPRDVMVAFSLSLVEQMQAQGRLFEALDSSGIHTRDAKRRGIGWLAGQADIGWSNRIGWYEGFHLLTSMTPSGMITGFGFAAGSCNDHHLPRPFSTLASRLRLACPASVCQRRASMSLIRALQVTGCIATGKLLTVQRWSMPHINASRVRWSKPWRPWLAGLRQIIETIYDKLLNTFRLGRLRPHALDGFQALLAAKVALHNLCRRLSLICLTGEFVILIHTKRYSLVQLYPKE